MSAARQPWPFPGPRSAANAAMLLPDISPDQLRAVVCELVQAAKLAGMVITVEQVPLKPLAMGHYETVVSVRPARGAA